MAKENLKFVCPKCGGNKLGQIQEVPMMYPITEIDPDGDFEYDTNNAIDAGGDVETISHECMDCGFIITKESGFPMVDLQDAANWIKNNCKQD